MTAKEKAFELFNKMYKYQLDKKAPISWELAKKQAFICVCEIIKVLIDYGTESYELQNMDSEFRFLDEVKNELEKL